MGNHLPILRLTKKPQFKGFFSLIYCFMLFFKLTLWLLSLVQVVGLAKNWLSNILKENAGFIIIFSISLKKTKKNFRLLLAARSEDKLKEVFKNFIFLYYGKKTIIRIITLIIIN